MNKKQKEAYKEFERSLYKKQIGLIYVKNDYNFLYFRVYKMLLCASLEFKKSSMFKLPFGLLDNTGILNELRRIA